MNMKEMLSNHLDIVVSLDVEIEEHIGARFIANKIIENINNEKYFEIPVGYVSYICQQLDKKNISYILKDNNEFVKGISLLSI